MKPKVDQFQSNFFKPEDFQVTRGWSHNDGVLSAEEAAKQANLKMKPKENEIELYVLVDKTGRILYTDHNEKSIVDYKESNGFSDKFVVKLKGEIK